MYGTTQFLNDHRPPVGRCIGLAGLFSTMDTHWRYKGIRNRFFRVHVTIGPGCVSILLWRQDIDSPFLFGRSFARLFNFRLEEQSWSSSIDSQSQVYDLKSAIFQSLSFSEHWFWLILDSSIFLLILYQVVKRHTCPVGTTGAPEVIPMKYYSTSRIVRGIATPQLWNICAHVPSHRLRIANRLPLSSMVTICRALRSCLICDHSNSMPFAFRRRSSSFRNTNARKLQNTWPRMFSSFWW